jgi:transcriptional regulator with XRE-family HTH domain
LKSRARSEVALAFGAVLKAARRGASVSQEALAERADIDRTYPSMLERGIRHPTLAIMLRIADALGMEPTELLAATLVKLRREGQG